MNRPLLPPALAFAGGILLDESLRLHPVYWLAAAAVALAVACGRSRMSTAGLWIGWISAGALAHGIHDTAVSPHDLRRLAESSPQIVELRGVLDETPSLRLREQRGQWTGRTMVRLEVTAWRPPDGDWTPAAGAVMTATRGVFPTTLFRGRRAEVSGVLQRPPGPAAPGLFNYREHLRHAGIFHTLDVARIEDWKATGPPDQRPPWSERFLPWAQKALARGLPDDEATRLLWAMTLGWRTALNGEVDTVFMESGTMHIFAIMVYNTPHFGILPGIESVLVHPLELRPTNRWRFIHPPNAENEGHL